MALTKALVCDCGTLRVKIGEYLRCNHCDGACPAVEMRCPKCRGFDVNASRRLMVR